MTNQACISPTPRWRIGTAHDNDNLPLRVNQPNTPSASCLCCACLLVSDIKRSPHRTPPDAFITDELIFLRPCLLSFHSSHPEKHVEHSHFSQAPPTLVDSPGTGVKCSAQKVGRHSDETVNQTGCFETKKINQLFLPDQLSWRRKV